MNRQIEFRAWDEKQQYMAYQGAPDLETLKSFMHHFGDCELMQWAGLHDKNGVKIYVGDIVKSERGDVMLVTFNKKYASFCLRKKEWVFDHYFGEAVDVNKVEVIGNVHQHPELCQ